MKNKLKLIIPFLLSVACSTYVEKDPAPEPENTDTSISLTEEPAILPDTVAIDPKLSPQEKIIAFKEKQLRLYSEVEATKGINPERFEKDTLIKFALKKNTPVKYGTTENVYPVATVFYLHYSDSTTFNNAFNNWMNCFGNDCTPIRFEEDMKSIKTTPSYTWINQDQLWMLHLCYQCEHKENDWNKWIDELDLLFGGKNTVRIETACGGPLKWK